MVHNRLTCCIKQQFEQRFSVTHNQRIQLVGQRKNQMIIRRWQQFLQPVFNPFFSFQTATIGAMAVAATVVLIVGFATVFVIAHQPMKTHFGGMTGG